MQGGSSHWICCRQDAWVIDIVHASAEADVAMMRCETGDERMEGLFMNTHFWLDPINRVIAWVTKAKCLNLCSQLP